MNSPLKPCPSTHPVRTPDINLHIIYPTSRGAGITFSSGSRYTAHADFINSWKQRALVTLVQTCINDQTRTRTTFVLLPTLDQGGAEANQGCSFTHKPKKNVKGFDSFTRGLDGKGGTDKVLNADPSDTIEADCEDVRFRPTS